MSTKAALQFRQRSKVYNDHEDGRKFNTWYHGDDIKRILWSKFQALPKEQTKDTIHPHVFFDGIDALSLEDILNPLVTKLKSSKQKYYPFIFKPELSGAHYVAGFLRKNEDSSISIILFNPTGTTLRMYYGDYAYNVRLMEIDEDDSDPEELDIEQNTIYVKAHKGTLQYKVINPRGAEVTNYLTSDDLERLGIDIDLSKPLTTEALNGQIKPKLSKILEITLSRNETEKKIQMISSPHKIQTTKKDGGKLVSCGPLCVEFIDYIINHQEYMSHLDGQFNLPSSLSSLIQDDVASYQNKIENLRKQHDEVLETIPDDSLDSIDEVYNKINAFFLEEHSKKTKNTNNDDPNEEADADSHYYDSLDEELAQEDGGEQMQNHTGFESSPAPSNNVQEEVKPVSLRADVLFITSEIQRFKDNAKSVFSINNTMKADKIEQALEEALRNNVTDVRNDEGVKEALAIHRIFGFFGCKQTTATVNNELSLVNSYLSKV